MKPLYLDGAQQLHVRLDGSVLVVHTDGSSDRMFPLRRISRITVSGRVDWSTSALMACADNGIVVDFLRARGSSRARLTPDRDQDDPLALLLESFLDHPDSLRLYEQWCRSRERMHAAECAWRLYLAREDWHDDPESAVRQLIRQRVGEARFDFIRGHLVALAAGDLAASLCKAGVSARTFPALLRDLGSIAIWRVTPQLLRRLCDDGDRTAGVLPSRKEVVALYEKYSTAIFQAMFMLLECLLRRLARVA